MSTQSGYKKQQNLALIQLLSEVPSFVTTLVAAIFSNTMLIFVDLMDSFGNVLRAALVTILSNKLTKDLRYEYNYGVGKIEAFVSLFCNGIVLCGLIITLGASIYALAVPEQPSKAVIAVVGLKVVNVLFDTTFFMNQRKILKTHKSAISEANYAASFAALLFDSVTLVSLIIIWLLRNNPIGGYVSPVISIFIAIYLIIGCTKRSRQAMYELTDKTLPEEQQMKILNVLSRFYDSYTQCHHINSQKSGELIRIDLHLSFDEDTNIERVVQLKKQIQDELENQLGSCKLNIIVEDE